MRLSQWCVVVGNALWGNPHVIACRGPDNGLGCFSQHSFTFPSIHFLPLDPGLSTDFSPSLASIMSAHLSTLQVFQK